LTGLEPASDTSPGKKTEKQMVLEKMVLAASKKTDGA